MKLKKMQKVNLPMASIAKGDKRPPNFTRKTQKCNED